MTETGPGRSLVIDSSALVAALIDSGETGSWVAASMTGGAALAAPQLAIFEAANILRREQLRAEIDATTATLAHQDLLALPVQLWPYAPLAGRCWQLRANVTMYDAAYVALAEQLRAPLISLDKRLGRASGIRCQVLSPPDTGS